MTDVEESNMSRYGKARWGKGGAFIAHLPKTRYVIIISAMWDFMLLLGQMITSAALGGSVAVHVEFNAMEIILMMAIYGFLILAVIKMYFPDTMPDGKWQPSYISRTAWFVLYLGLQTVIAISLATVSVFYNIVSAAQPTFSAWGSKEKATLAFSILCVISFLAHFFAILFSVLVVFVFGWNKDTQMDTARLVGDGQYREDE